MVGVTAGVAHEVETLQASDGVNEFGLGARRFVDTEHLQAGVGVDRRCSPGIVHE